MRSIKKRTRGTTAERSIEKYKGEHRQQQCHNDKIIKEIKDKIRKKRRIVKSMEAFITAGGRFIDQNFVRRKKISTQLLHKPIPVYNVDGTPNKKGTIREFVCIPV